MTTGGPPRPRRAAARRRGGPEETEAQRWRRHFDELLQELRVAQTGVQILFAFLLILAFSPGFEPSDGFVRATYVVALLTAASATALIIAPVSHHRLLYRLRLKPVLVRTANRLALAGLAMLLVSTVAALLLATDRVLARPAAVAVSTATGAGFALLWWLSPLRLRHSRERGYPPSGPGTVGDVGIGSQRRSARGTVGHAYSALNLRLVLAAFGLVTSVVLAVVSFSLDAPLLGWLLVALAVVAAVDLVVIQLRRRARRREHPDRRFSLFE